MEGLGHDMILLSSLIGKIVAEAAREFYLSVVVNITSDLGHHIKHLMHYVHNDNWFIMSINMTLKITKLISQ